MRIITGAIAALLMTAGAAMAADDEGRISNIDAEGQTITLDNGNTYALPGEFDVEALTEGMEVVVAYEDVEGRKQITDLVTYE